MATEHHPLRVLVASKETFDVSRFSIEESLSELFSVSIIATSGNPSIDFDKIIGQPASFSLRTATGDSPDRLWTGICDHAEQIQGITPGASGAKTKEQSTYYIHIVPFFWKTTQTSNHRIFQQKTVKDIVSELLKEWKLKVRWELTRKESFYRKYDYIVQYGESDHDFIRRLLQREGITHLFRFLGDKETELILSDQPQTGKRRKQTIRAFDTPQESHGSEYLTHVRISHTIQPGVVTLRDYDFRTKYNLLTKSASKDKVDAPENFYEQYHYAPGAFLVDMQKSPGGKTPNADDKGIFARHDTAEGEKLAQLMLESQRKYKQRVRFETNCPDLAPGVIFTMDEHPRPEMNAPVLVTRFFFEGTATGEWTGGGEASFIAVPHVPDFKTPKPKIIGMQSAIVVGPDKNQEIHTDEHGRVRVKFHWDRRKEADDNSSCWLRVSQDWAGIGFGSFMLPRIGQEVLVAFYEGDPDHPIVVGRVYNETNPVPYKLPKHRTRSTWKTDSSPKSTGFSELMFEDKDKHELVYLQAQKDMQKLVKNDETERTFRDRLSVVGEQRQNVVGLLDATMVGDNYLLELIEPPNKGALGIQGQTDPDITATDTKIEMRDERIIFTTGKATVAFDGKNIRFDADGDITIRSEKKDVILEGKMMFINTMTPPPAPNPGATVPPKQGSEDLDHLYDEATKAAVALAGAALKIARDVDGRAIIPAFGGRAAVTIQHGPPPPPPTGEVKSCSELWKEYESAAEDLLNSAGPDVIERNKVINGAYADLALESPEFTWAGEAAYASKQVGCGMQHAANLSDKWYVPSAPPDFGKKMLAKTNRDIFIDAYPAHQFYKDHGAKKLRECGAERNEFPLTEATKKAFDNLDEYKATGNSELLKSHGRNMLDHEQRELAQSTAYANKRLRTMLIGTQQVSKVAPSVAPPAEVVFEPGCDGERKSSFQGWDLGNEQQRMDWVNGDMEKTYYDLVENSPDVHTAQLKQLRETGLAAGAKY